MSTNAVIIAAAIALCAPSMPHAQRVQYAKVIVSEAPKARVAPFDIVALVDGESTWNSRVVSSDGEYYGLGQVRVRYLPACKSDLDPIGNPSSACQAAKVRLLEGTNNLRLTVQLAGKWRKICQKQTGRQDQAYWMSGYKGHSNPSRGMVCGLQRTPKGWRPLPLLVTVKRTLATRRRLYSHFKIKHV